MSRVLPVVLLTTLAVLLLIGCSAVPTAQRPKENREPMVTYRDPFPFGRLQHGMTPEEVVQLKHGGRPFTEDKYRGKNGEAVLVYKYPTHPVEITSFVPPNTDGRINPLGPRVVHPMAIVPIYQDEELTPLIFVNNALEGWGWSYLVSASKKYGFVVVFKHR